MINRIVRLFTSLKLTVVLLSLSLILVFWGTLAQVTLGLYQAQNDFFRSFFIFWQPAGADFRVPIFPGGYLLGGLLLINLIAAHTRYYQSGWKKSGIVMIHGGVVLLLVGQLLTDFLSTESSLHLRNGQTKNYSEADRRFELAVVDTSDAETDKVVAIPASLLAVNRGGDLSHPELPVKVRVRKFFTNSALTEKPEAGFEPVPVSSALGSGLFWRELPPETAMQRRDMPSGIVELIGPNGSLGEYLVSSFLSRPQEFVHDGRTYQLSLRFERHYKPFSLTLLEFRHDRYPGTQIPKNFSSRVRLLRPDTGEDREVLIYMNNPLRYGGETYYQASFDTDDQGTILQVVRNPSWLTPYLACVIVSLGLTVQFLIHLVPFLKRRLTT